MIDKSYGQYCIVCDACGEISADKFETWQDAVDGKADAGYSSKPCKGKWIDLCEDCNSKGD